MKTELDRQIEVMQAFRDGKAIECLIKDEEIYTWNIVHVPCWNWREFDYRIAVPIAAFPKLPPGEEWHNPDNLTPEQFECDKGWRPCLKSECLGVKHEFWNCSGVRWELAGEAPTCYAQEFVSTYRTREPLPKPKVIVPLEAEDIPPVCWVRRGDSNCSYLITAITPDFIRCMRVEYCVHYEELMKEGWLYSTDLKTWHKCEKEASSLTKSSNGI